MKKYSFVVISILWCTTLLAQITTISGKAPKGATEMSLLIQKNSTIPFESAVVDQEGNYVIKLPLETTSLLQLASNANSNYTPLFIRKGDNIIVNFEPEGVVFQGDEVVNNQFLQLFTTRLTAINRANNVGVEDILKYRDSFIKRHQEIVAFIDASNLKDKEFRQTLKLNQVLTCATAILNTPSIYQLLSGGKSIELEADYYKPILSLPLASPYLQNITYAPWFLSDYFSTLEAMEIMPTDLENYLVKRAVKVKNKRAREDYVLLEIAKLHYFYNQYFLQLCSTVEKYVTTNSGKEELKKLKEKYVPIEKFNSGMPALNFKALDANGKTHQLSDYKGNIVLIDLWDTGCVPCIAEMPYLEKLEHYFEGKPVQFISLSLDKDVNKWLKFMSQRKMSGIQLNDVAGQKSEFVTFYQMRGVPRFILIDKQGNIIETNAPRPSDRRLKLLIERELKK